MRHAAFLLGVGVVASIAAAQVTSPFAPSNATPGGSGSATRPLATQPITPRGLRQINTPYYMLFTDVSDGEAREADLRLTRMFEEYTRRTAQFASPVKEKLPFYLFRRESDYLAAGGPPKSAGVYMESANGNKRLMAIAGDHVDDNTWSVVQHEGFHQFVAAAIKRDIPIWVNEGLAEYFGDCRWTGDAFFADLISPSRLKAVRRGITTNFVPFRQFMSLSDEQWVGNLKESNYDQAWSMIYFLANGDDGKYRGAFLQYMTAVSKGVKNDQAWDAAFGRNNDQAFQQRYAQWWAGVPDNPTRMGYIQAMVQTQTSFLARAVLMGRKIPDANTFVQRDQPPAFVDNRDLWLPPNLFTDWSSIAPDVGDWSFKGQQLVLKVGDGSGTVMVGSFTLANGKVSNVTVNVSTPPAGRGR